MIIRMYHQMSSGRHDGRAWPPPGVDFEVPDWEGHDLVQGGNAVVVSEKETPAYTPPPEVPPGPEPQPWPPYEPGRLAGPAAAPEPAPEPAAEPVLGVAPEPPRPGQPKADWVSWAVSNGVSEEEASQLTKQQLMEAYGQRA